MSSRERDRGELEPGTKNQERPGRGVPGGDQPCVPPPGRAAPGPWARERPAASARNGRCEGGIQAKGENGAGRRGSEEGGGGEPVGRKENLEKSDGLEEGRRVRFADVQDCYSHDQYF